MEVDLAVGDIGAGISTVQVIRRFDETIRSIELQEFPEPLSVCGLALAIG